MKFLLPVASVLLLLCAQLSLYRRPAFIEDCLMSYQAKLDPGYVEAAVARYDWVAIDFPLLLAVGSLLFYVLDRYVERKRR